MNNSINGYGTASIVRNNLSHTNLLLDSYGRIIIFDIDEVTFGNFYIPSGTDNNTRNLREQYFAEIIPNMLINRKQHGLVGGDINSILCEIELRSHPHDKN